MPHLRFLNAEGGQHRHIWQFKAERVPFQPAGGSGETISHYHLSPEWMRSALPAFAASETGCSGPQVFPTAQRLACSSSCTSRADPAFVDQAIVAHFCFRHFVHSCAPSFTVEGADKSESAIDCLGSRLIDYQSQKMTVAARATAERKVVAHLS